ncbi:MAG: choice-of-anchor Q domain-containing protein, partial [Cyclobacteriaceae bacterium]
PDYKGSCVFLGSGSGIIIRYNQFWGNRNANGIYHHVENLSIYYNTFSRFRNGIVSYHDSTCLVLNNTFYACNYAIQGTNIKSINNIFDNKTGLHVPYHEVKKLDNKNNHYTSGYPGKLSTKGDPGFVNGEKGNFRLTPGSPCINKGMPNDIPFDLFGNKVPSGTLPDIGACEFERKPP